MFSNAFKKLSLRTRLIILTAFALVSVFAAIFVAWRLVKTTQTFTVFQTENELRAAARELAQEIRLAPEGFDEQADAPAAPPRPKAPPPPPHVSETLRQYAEPFARLTALGLHRYDKLGGGFYRANEEKIFGYVAKDAALPADIERFSQISAIRAALAEAAGDQKNLTRRFSDGSETFLLAVEPLAPASDASAAWTIERLPRFAVSDSATFAALGFLILAIGGVGVFAFITVRDLGRDTTNIKTELADLELNLEAELHAPRTREFAVIVAAINDLSRRLRANLEKQNQLETTLRQSEKLSALGRVASGVAHEIRNPLAAIKLKIQIAERREPDAKLAQTFRVVTEEIDRLDLIVTRLLEFGKAQNLSVAALDLNRLLQTRADFFSESAAQRNVKLTRANLGDSLMIEGDEKRLTEVFDNLLQNALNAVANGGNISVESRASNDTARVEIRDDGDGIDADARPKIFEPFFTTRDDGTGLGLAIAREIVEAHGGKIYFESEPERGAAFFVELPKSAPPPFPAGDIL